MWSNLVCIFYMIFGAFIVTVACLVIHSDNQDYKKTHKPRRKS